MKYFFIRSHLVFVSLILFITMAMTMVIVMKYNQRWDLTQEKIFSLSPPTEELLTELRTGVIEVLAFYPHDDPAAADFEIFLKECQMHHPHFKFTFYDPDRVPRLAKENRIKDLYTIVIRYGDQQERVVRPTEESFTNALLKLANPIQINICFVTGHGEASVEREDRNGYRLFRQALEDSNYSVNEIILSRDKVPSLCNVVAVAGPHRDLDGGERELLRKSFHQRRGILFLIDPMDLGQGESFGSFMRDFGVVLGSDVIVDKMSRMVGGDFLVPLVSQYVSEHPITADFQVATFFPVARSVQPSTEDRQDLWVTPLAFSGSGSWSETDLSALERGEAAFQAESDISGPISIAVAVEEIVPPGEPAGGRMVVIGDSDFLTNAYLDLSGNRDLALNSIQWLAKDDRFISIRPRRQKFEPLLLDSSKKVILFFTVIGGLPFVLFLITAIRLIWRAKTS